MCVSRSKRYRRYSDAATVIDGNSPSPTAIAARCFLRPCVQSVSFLVSYYFSCRCPPMQLPMADLFIAQQGPDQLEKGCALCSCGLRRLMYRWTWMMTKCSYLCEKIRSSHTKMYIGPQFSVISIQVPCRTLACHTLADDLLSEEQAMSSLRTASSPSDEKPRRKYIREIICLTQNA